MSFGHISSFKMIKEKNGCSHAHFFSSMFKVKCILTSLYNNNNVVFLSVPLFLDGDQRQSRELEPPTADQRQRAPPLPEQRPGRARLHGESKMTQTVKDFFYF